MTQPSPADELARWEVVDAFLTAARGGDLGRLLELLAPDVIVTADAAAAALGSPERITGRDAVAGFFDGAAKTAFPVLVGGRAGAAWVHRGEARVVFDFVIADGRVAAIEFRADPAVLATVELRPGHIRGGPSVR